MSVRLLVIAAGLLFAVPAFAQVANPQAAQNAANLEVLQKLYPPRALAAHEEGTVGFKLTLDSKGTVTQCQVTHSSGHPLLDQETCNLISMHAEFKPEQGSSGSQVRTRDGVIGWKLPGSSTQIAPARQMADASPPEKVICKRTVKIGTLAGFERTCMTPREWAHQTDEERATWQEMQGSKGSTHGN